MIAEFIFLLPDLSCVELFFEIGDTKIYQNTHLPKISSSFYTKH